MVLGNSVCLLTTKCSDIAVNVRLDQCRALDKDSDHSLLPKRTVQVSRSTEIAKYVEVTNRKVASNLPPQNAFSAFTF